MIHVLADVANNTGPLFVFNWQDYLHTQFDGAHLLTEIMTTIVFDGLLVGVGWKLLWPKLKRRIIRSHDAQYHVGECHHLEVEPWLND